MSTMFELANGGIGVMPDLRIILITMLTRTKRQVPESALKC